MESHESWTLRAAHLLQHLSGQVGIQRGQRHGRILKDLRSFGPQSVTGAAKCLKKNRNGGIQVIHLEFFIFPQSWGYHGFFRRDSGAKLVFGVPPPGEHEPTHQVHHFTAAERTFSGEFRCCAMFRHTQIHYPLVQSQLLTLSMVTLW